MTIWHCLIWLIWGTAKCPRAYSFIIFCRLSFLSNRRRRKPELLRLSSAANPQNLLINETATLFYTNASMQNYYWILTTDQLICHCEIHTLYNIPAIPVRRYLLFNTPYVYILIVFTLCLYSIHTSRKPTRRHKIKWCNPMNIFEWFKIIRLWLSQQCDFHPSLFLSCNLF